MAFAPSRLDVADTPPRGLEGGIVKDAKIPRLLATQLQALIEEAEAVRETDPAMGEAAAMVYIGDVYALREIVQPVDNTGWGTRRYAGHLGDDPL